VILKRNLLVMAMASSGLCMAFSAQAATDNIGMQVSAGTSSKTDTDNQRLDDSKKAKNKQQELDAKKLRQVQVNGFISSIENSTALKRNASTIVEAVSSEQVGKLPGVSIADSLGRLPGLAVQTVDGRPQVLSIHGLGPDFSTALVNGGQQVSTSNNRDVQFDQYPSSWFDNVEVHLSPEADLIGQGLAGTVDMHTIRPLEKGVPEAAMNVRYIWNDMSQLAPGSGVSNKGYNVNGIWVNQFADHTVGVTLGVDLENNPSQIEHQGPWGYPQDADADYVVGGSKNYAITDSMKRNGFLATVQWKPNDHYTGTIDVTTDNFKDVQQAKGMEFPLFWGSNVGLTPGRVGNGFVYNGIYTNVKPIVRNDFNSTTARVYNFNWDNKFTINEDWSMDLDGNYSRATRRDINLESYSGTGYNETGATDTVRFNELNGLLYLNPSLNYGSGVVLTDPEGWGSGNKVVQAGFINAPHTVDYLANLRLSVERDFVSGPFSNMQFGLARSTRSKTYNIAQDFLTLGGGSINDGNAVMSAPLSGASSCDPLSWMGIGSQVCYAPFSLISNGTLDEVPTFMSSLSLPPNWRVHETDLNPYLQFNLDTHLGSVGLRGNFGLQVDHTDQISSGERVAPGSSLTGGQTQLIPVSGGTNYTRYLPSLNLIFGLTDNDDFRVSVARTMAQPRMDQMNASLAVTGNITQLASNNPNQAYFGANGGNAQLLPTMADNYNVSYEHYFSAPISGYRCNDADSKDSDLCRGGGGGYFAVSGYFLSLHDYIDPNAAFLYDFSAFIPAYLSPAQQALLGTPYGTVSGPTNDGHGYVKGAQVTLNLPFGLLTPLLDGFGTILTGNRTKSSLIYGDNPSPITVPGLSKWVGNGTLYYQHGGFEARVGDSYRSNFLGEVSGISASRIEQDLKGGSTFDAQVSYTFNHGAFKGLTLIAQGSNLSNKIFDTFQNNDPRQVLLREVYGRTYSVGASYKFQ
jgi:iron complex outermembrane recepter protein